MDFGFRDLPGKLKSIYEVGASWSTSHYFIRKQEKKKHFCTSEKNSRN
jgi:hypothetical protein